MKGKVKWFNSKRGFGFVTGEDKTDYFAHFSNITMDGYKKLRDGQDVEFDPLKNDKGLQAVNIKPLGGGVERRERKDEGGGKGNGER